MPLVKSIYSIILSAGLIQKRVVSQGLVSTWKRRKDYGESLRYLSALALADENFAVAVLVSEHTLPESLVVSAECCLANVRRKKQTQLI
jgi:hypothetical protein